MTIGDIVSEWSVGAPKKFLEDCKPIDNSNFAFSIIALVIQTVLIVIALINFFKSDLKILLSRLIIPFFFFFFFFKYHIVLNLIFFFFITLVKQWFSIGQCAMFVCTAIVWMVNMTYFQDGCYNSEIVPDEYKKKVYWAYIVCFVLCIVCAATSVIVTLPCCSKAIFIYIHMICCTAHVVFCWISQLGKSCTGYGYQYYDWNNDHDKARDYRFISYTLVEFIMITIIYLCSVIVFFKVSFKL